MKVEPPFSDAQLDALYAAIQVNDVVDDAVTLPTSIRLEYDQARLIDGFRLSRQLWRAGFDRDALGAMATTLWRGHAFDDAAQLRFKHVRAKFKHLRFAFVLYGGDHRCPRAFKTVTTIMGHLQDAFRRGDRPAIRRHAGLLRVALSGGAPWAMRREVDRFVPSDTGDFRGFVCGQMATLRGMLASDTITGHQFHAARKIVSRQVSFHDDMRTLHSDPEHFLLSHYLSAINGLMGEFHDGLVLQRAAGALDYDRAGFAMPADIRHRLSALVALYPAD